MAGASLEIMAASRPCLQTLQSQNYGKNKFRIQEKGEKWPNCSQRGTQGSQPTCSLKQDRRGAPLSERVWGPDANYTKMILELLTDSLHFRATPCGGCLRGQMLRLLPSRIYFVFVFVEILN